MSEELNECILEVPGHNIPRKIRLGKLKRIKRLGAYLEPRGRFFTLHDRCVQPPGCGYSRAQRELFLFTLEHSGSYPKLWEDKETLPSSRCLGCRSYFTHDYEGLLAALETRNSGGLIVVQTRNLKGLIVYLPNAKRYFWLEDNWGLDGFSCDVNAAYLGDFDE